MEAKTKQSDVVIIGAGPVGLFAVFECGMLGLSCSVIDSLPEIGGQCTALYPEKPIYDIPALPDVLAGDLIHNLEKQATPFKPDYNLGQQVTKVERQGERFLIETDQNLSIECGAVIIAAGAGAFGPNRPPLDNIKDFESKSVFYMVRDRESLSGKDIVIAGGGDSAVDWALALAPKAKSLTIVHRRDKFRAAPASVEQLRELEKNKVIQFIIPAQLAHIKGKGGQIETIGVQSLDDKSITEVKADILLPFFGLAASLGPIADWNLELQGQTIHTNQATSETSQPGIYAVGDIAGYDHKLKLILTGFAEAAQAAHHIWARLNPGETMHMQYSTSKGLPKK